MHYSHELECMRKSCPGSQKDINKPLEMDYIPQQFEKRTKDWFLKNINT